MEDVRKLKFKGDWLIYKTFVCPENARQYSRIKVMKPSNTG